VQCTAALLYLLLCLFIKSLCIPQTVHVSAEMRSAIWRLLLLLCKYPTAYVQKLFIVQFFRG
jgi:hypothetical protein